MMPRKRVPIMMTTADMSMRMDPIYEPIARHFHEHPDELADAFARAWFKLTHRDMGPRVRYLGPEVPDEELIWQDPIPEVDHELIGEADIATLKGKILDSGLSLSELVSTAWASASTFRGSDMRGGANGARIRLAPQKDWEVNQPDQLGKVMKQAGSHPRLVWQEGLSGRSDRAGRLRGYRAGRKKWGSRSDGSVHPGPHGRLAGTNRCLSFSFLEPEADGFRNYLKTKFTVSAEEMLVDRAQLLTLTPPEMTVLVGGMRVLNTNFDQSKQRRLHQPKRCVDQRFLR